MRFTVQRRQVVSVSLIAIIAMVVGFLVGEWSGEKRGHLQTLCAFTVADTVIQRHLSPDISPNELLRRIRKTLRLMEFYEFDSYYLHNYCFWIDASAEGRDWIPSFEVLDREYHRFQETGTLTLDVDESR